MDYTYTPIVISIDGADGGDIAIGDSETYYRDFEEQPDVSSVTGENGVEESDGGDELVQAGPVAPVIRLGGKSGRAAREAISGADGGLLHVSVRPSKDVPGNVVIKVVENTSSAQLPETWEIPQGHNVILASRGGRGEDGKRGGDGSNGIPGPDGDNATQMSAAGDGVHGGHGGNAGPGSDGGDGGNGGEVYIQVNEQNTHLLLAVDWDVSAGLGGHPGQHGNPGLGAPGGRGGAGCKWKQFQRMEYRCTNNCQGDPSLAGRTNNALVPFVGTGNRDRFEVSVNGDVSVRLLRDGETVANPNNVRTFNVDNTTQVPAGVNWQQALVKSVIDSQETNSSALAPYVRLPSHICKCRGGAAGSFCLGCRQKEIHSKVERARGRDGPPGMNGAPVKVPLKEGRRGIPGLGRIVVINAQKQRTTYTSRYNIQVAGFEIEDGNGDGVFEPGEDIFITAIKIKNLGGMPTPGFTFIPITVQETNWIIPYDEDTPVHIPYSIPPGGTAYVQGKIRAFINYRPKGSPTPTEAFHEVTSISLKATVPDIDREIPHFSKFKREVVIQYPISIESVQFMKCVPQGAQTALKWTIQNHAHKEFGIEGLLNRAVSARLSLSKGSELSIASNGKGTKTVDMPRVSPNGTQSYEEAIEISRSAEPDTVHQYRLSLYLSIPNPDRDRYPLRLIQERFFEIQIGEGWSKTPGSKYLLVVNEATPNVTIVRWKSFIREVLKMEVDVFNVSLLGSLYKDETKTTIFREYGGKSIVFFCNRFDFFERKDCTVLDLIPPETIAKETAFRGTSIILVGALSNTIESKAWLKDFVRPIVAESREEMGGDFKYDTMKSLISTMHERRVSGIEPDNFSTYTIPIQRSSSVLTSRDAQIRKQAKKTAEKLQKEMPNSRFSVSVVSGNEAQDNNVVKIFTGAPRRTSFVATAPETIISKISNSRDGALEKLELFTCISALPLYERLQLLYPTSESQPLADDEQTRRFAQFATELSIVYEVQSELVYLFKTFIKHGWSKSISEKDFLSLFPCLDAILSYPAFLMTVSTNIATDGPYIRMVHRILSVISSATICGKFTRMMGGLTSSQPDIIRNILESLECKLLNMGYDKKKVKAMSKCLKKYCTETSSADVLRATLNDIAKLVRLGVSDLLNTLAFSKDLIDSDETVKAIIIKQEDVATKMEKGQELHQQVEKETTEAIKELDRVLTIKDRTPNLKFNRQRKFEFETVEEETTPVREVVEEVDTTRGFVEEGDTNGVWSSARTDGESESDDEGQLVGDYYAQFQNLPQPPVPYHPSDGRFVDLGPDGGYESDGGTHHFRMAKVGV